MVRIWNPVTGKAITELAGHRDSIKHVAFSPDGTRLVTGGNNYYDKFGAGRLWDATTGRAIGVLEGQQGHVNSIAFSPDGKLLVTASSNHKAWVWDVKTGTPIAELEGHRASVDGVAFSPDGNRIATASSDGTARLWDAATGATIASLGTYTKEAQVTSVAFSPDGNRVATGSSDGRVRLWQVFPNIDALVAYSKSVVPFCLSLAERRSANLVTDPPSGPPTWCITGPGLIGELSQSKWQPKSPYHTKVWRDWLLANTSREANGPLPTPPEITRKVGAAFLKGELALDGAEYERAIVAFTEAVRLAREPGGNPEQLRRVLFERGNVHSANKAYAAAIADFAEAKELGHEHSGTSLWWARNSLGDQLLEDGKLVESFITTWGNLLDADPKVLETISLSDLISHHALSYSIAALYVRSRVPTAHINVTECDRLTSHPADPFRVSDAVDFDKIDSRLAIEACDDALLGNPNESRFLFQRGRAHDKAAAVAAEKDESLAAKHDTAKITDLKAAMARGYPMAFNNMGVAVRDGHGVKKNQEKANELFLQRLNRIIHCCWHTAANHLIAEADKYDQSKVYRIINVITGWAAALGSDGAKSLFDRFHAIGALTDAGTWNAKASFSDIPPWFKRARKE